MLWQKYHSTVHPTEFHNVSGLDLWPAFTALNNASDGTEALYIWAEADDTNGAPGSVRLLIRKHLMIAPIGTTGEVTILPLDLTKLEVSGTPDEGRERADLHLVLHLRGNAEPVRIDVEGDYMHRGALDELRAAVPTLRDAVRSAPTP